MFRNRRKAKSKNIFRSDFPLGNFGLPFQTSRIFFEIFCLAEPKLSYHLHPDRNFRNFLLMVNHNLWHTHIKPLNEDQQYFICVYFEFFRYGRFLVIDCFVFSFWEPKQEKCVPLIVLKTDKAGVHRS